MPISLDQPMNYQSATNRFLTLSFAQRKIRDIYIYDPEGYSDLRAKMK